MTETLQPTLQSRYLATMRISLEGSIEIGDTPAGWRRMDILKGGTIDGPAINGSILAGGSDIVSRFSNRTLAPDIRFVIRTDDQADILVTYRGLRHCSKDVEDRVAAGEVVDPADFYLRTTPTFLTAAPSYDWLNHIVAVGLGRREQMMVIYDLFEIL